MGKRREERWAEAERVESMSEVEVETADALRPVQPSPPPSTFLEASNDYSQRQYEPIRTKLIAFNLLTLASFSIFLITRPIAQTQARSRACVCK